MHTVKTDGFRSGWITARLYVSELGHPPSSALAGERQQVKLLFREVLELCAEGGIVSIREGNGGKEGWLKRKGERKNVNERKLGSCGK